MSLVFIVTILSSVTVSVFSTVTCNGEVRARDPCYHARYCEADHIKEASSNDVDLSVTCSGSNAFVSWSAPDKPPTINLYYHCFWTKNNTKISKFPIYFQDRSNFHSSSTNLAIAALTDGVHCIFGGCYQLELNEPFSHEFPNSTCGVATASFVTLSSGTQTHSSMTSTATLPVMSTSTQTSLISTLFPQSSDTLLTTSNNYAIIATTSSMSSTLALSSTTTTNVLTSISSTFLSSTTNIPFTACSRSAVHEQPLFAASIVLIAVAVALVKIALVLFCYTFYFWKRISRARTAVDIKVLTDIKIQPVY